MTHLDLSGRVALVTGAKRGIGWATCELLAEHGATVVLVGRDTAGDLEERAAQLVASFSGEHSFSVCDVQDVEQIRATMRTVFKTYKRLDVLVNNAGILDDALIGMVTPEAIEATYRTNTFSAIEFTQSAARLMKRHGGGSIVNLTSIVGVNGNAGQIVYSSSKAALLGLTYSAAKELAEFGIRVNAVAPGFIDTDMARSLPEDKFQERIDSLAMKRIGTADDIAKTILFLASDLSTYVTGQVIGVDGGMLI